MYSGQLTMITNPKLSTDLSILAEVRTFFRSSVGHCNLVEFDDDLPAIYQNFAKVEGVTKRNLGKV